ncbi:MAG: hypothetical protein AB2805_19500 [Candidatus Thiodiazotropha sp.]
MKAQSTTTRVKRQPSIRMHLHRNGRYFPQALQTIAADVATPIQHD